MRFLTVGVLALGLILTTSACGDEEDAASDAPADNLVDGTWSITSITCDGGEIPIGQFTLVINGDSGEFIQGFGPECVVMLEEDYSYPTSSSIAITPTAITCEPSSGCPAVFGGAECPPLSPPVTFDFTRDGDALTFTKTAAPGDACPMGSAQVVNMVKE